MSTFPDHSTKSAGDNGEASRPENSSTPTPDDVFSDLNRLRLRQDFAEIGVKKVITTVGVRKPNRHEWIRVRPGEDWSLQTVLFTNKVDGDLYLVMREFWKDLSDEVQPVQLRTTLTRQGIIFLWPLVLPAADGRWNIWHESAAKAATLAETHWIRVASDRPAGCYATWQASSDLGEPEWPEDMGFQDLLRLAFKERTIDSWNHPQLKALRGEV